MKSQEDVDRPGGRAGLPLAMGAGLIAMQQTGSACANEDVTLTAKAANRKLCLAR